MSEENKKIAVAITRGHAALFGGPKTPAVTIADIKLALDAKDERFNAVVSLLRECDLQMTTDQRLYQEASGGAILTGIAPLQRRIALSAFPPENKNRE